MSIKKDASGKRWIEVEIEVPGTPEEVWQAIATGPGVSSWFVPTQMEERDGIPVTVTMHFGPGSSMDSIATMTAWDPPRRFAAESHSLGPNAPAFATEWIVEARAGGTCIVRVVNSLFTSSDDWDDQLENIESGWPTFFRILRLYLTHFRGLPVSSFRSMGAAAKPETAAWDALTGALGLTGLATKGARFRTSAGAPLLAGTLEDTGKGGIPHALLLRLDEPGPGAANIYAHTMDDKVYVMADVYLYGDRAPALAPHHETLWREWIAAHFDAVGETAC